MTSAMIDVQNVSTDLQKLAAEICGFFEELLFKH